MRYYRLIEKSADRSPLGFGNGAGRWNYFGIPLIYASNVSSLNFLELLSIRGGITTRIQWELIELEINEELSFISVGDLPVNWYVRPHPTSTQLWGSNWSQATKSVTVAVPSCRIPLVSYPAEHNLLINPMHPDFTKCVKFVARNEVSFQLNT